MERSWDRHSMMGMLAQVTSRGAGWKADHTSPARGLHRAALRGCLELAADRFSTGLAVMSRLTEPLK